MMQPSRHSPGGSMGWWLGGSSSQQESLIAPWIAAWPMGAFTESIGVSTRSVVRA